MLKVDKIFILMNHIYIIKNNWEQNMFFGAIVYVLDSDVHFL